MKLNFKEFGKEYSGVLLGTISKSEGNPGYQRTYIIILNNDGYIEECDIKCISGCKIVSESKDDE